MSEKRMVVFAGPNGSGKSTIVKNALENGSCPADFICPDNFTGDFIKAAQEAEMARHASLILGKSFTFETVLSTREKLEFIRRAKWMGYKVQVVYVTTNNPQINIERVKIRVAQGGHDVPIDKILSRYEKAMSLMFDVMSEADEVMFYDNSGDEPRLVATKFSTLCALREPPEWLEAHILSKARARGMTAGTLTCD